MISRLQNGHCHEFGYPATRTRLANLVAAEASGVGQLAGLETSGLRGAAGERNGAVAVAIGWASSGSGHTGGRLVVLLILAAVILLIVILIVVILVVAVLVRVLLVGAAVLEVGVILVTTGGGRSGSRRGSLQWRCVSTDDALRHERNQNTYHSDGSSDGDGLRLAVVSASRAARTRGRRRNSDQSSSGGRGGRNCGNTIRGRL